MASIFTRIINGEIPSYKIAEDENFVAFLDINPVQKGHTLIVPKKEVEYLFDIEDDLLGKMMIFAKQVARKIKHEIPCKRVAVVVIGLEVPHAHIHLIPIHTEKDIDFSNKITLQSSELIDIASKLSMIKIG